MENQKIHQLEQLRQRMCVGDLSRREFLKLAMLLGIGSSTAMLSAMQKTSTELLDPEWADPNFDASIVEPTRAIPGNFNYERRVTPTPAVDKPFRPNTWKCNECGEAFNYLDEFQRHAKDHAIHMPFINHLEKPEYEDWIVGEVERFPQQNIAFMRAMWDMDFQAEVMKVYGNCHTWNDIEEIALSEGASYVDDLIQSVLVKKDGIFYPTLNEDTIGKATFQAGPFSITQPSKDIARKVDTSNLRLLSEKVRSACKLFGADLVGFCQMDPRWVYSTYMGENGPQEQPLPLKNVIVLGFAMDPDEMKSSPDMYSNAEPYIGYTRMAVTATGIAKYITEMGYPAQPCFNDMSQSVPLAINAGLGEQGRHGLLVTPQYGPCVRLAKVFTDLPLEYDQPIEFGLQEYCKNCKICALSCPVRAIAMDGEFSERTDKVYSICNRSGIRKWVADTAGCYLYWRKNGAACGNCIAACPWTISLSRNWLDY